MRTYILRRLVHTVPVLLGVATIVFLALRLIPGDPAVALAGEKASVAEVERMREALGLNKPLPLQYVDFMSKIATFQFGHSLRTGGDIGQELVVNFAPTIELSFAALRIALIIGLPAGILAAIKRHSGVEYVTMIGSLVGISMPVFWIGLMLIYWLGARAGLLATESESDSPLSSDSSGAATRSASTSFSRRANSSSFCRSTS